MQKSSWSVVHSRDSKTRKLTSRLTTVNELGVGGGHSLTEKDCIEIATILLGRAREMRLERESGKKR